MPTKATNQKKAIITNSIMDVQLAKSAKPLPYHKKEAAGDLPLSDNQIETYKASLVETCTHTFVGFFLVVHDQTKIGHPTSPFPSWYQSNKEVLGAPPHGIGKAGKQVQYFAQAVKKSPDLMVEGKWAEREGDATQQDNGNGAGTFIYRDGLTEVPDDSDLVFAQCGVSSVKLECSHGRWVTVDEKSGKAGNILEVFIGDKVKVTATRVNLAETNPKKRHVTRCDFALYKEKRKPPPEETRHAAFFISRDILVPVPGVTPGCFARTNVAMVGANSSATDPTSKETVETTVLELGEDWLLKDPNEKEEPKETGAIGTAVGGAVDKGIDKGKAAVGKRVDNVEALGAEADKELPRLRQENTQAALDQRAATREAGSTRYEAGGGAFNQNARNSSDRARQDAAAAAVRKQQAIDRKGAAYARLQDAQTASDAGQVARVAKGVYEHVDSFTALLAFINFQALNVTINAHGCSKGPVAIVRAYPKGDVVCDLWKFKDFPFKDTVEVIKNCVQKVKAFLKQIKGSKVAGQGAPDEAGEAADATVSAGFFTIGFIFFQREIKKVQGQAVTQTKRKDDDLGPKLAVHAEWKELERDSDPAKKEKAGLKKWMVRRAWQLEVGIEKLLGLYFSCDVPLLAMSFCAPLQRVLSFFGIEAGPYIKFEIALSFGLVATFTWNEYGTLDPQLGSVPVEAMLKLTLYVKLGDAAECGIVTSGVWTPTYKIMNDPNGQACIAADESKITIVCEVYARFSLGIFGKPEYKKVIDTWEIAIGKTSWPIIRTGA